MSCSHLSYWNVPMVLVRWGLAGMRHNSVVRSQLAFLLLSQFTGCGRRESLELGGNKAGRDLGTSISQQQSTSYWIKHISVPVPHTCMPPAHIQGCHPQWWPVDSHWLGGNGEKLAVAQAEMSGSHFLTALLSFWVLARPIGPKRDHLPASRLSTPLVKTRALGERWWCKNTALAEYFCACNCGAKASSDHGHSCHVVQLQQKCHVGFPYLVTWLHLRCSSSSPRLTQEPCSPVLSCTNWYSSKATHSGSARCLRPSPCRSSGNWASKGRL